MKTMNWLQEIKKSFLTSLWFMFLTFPLMVMKVSTIGDNNVTLYRWKNMVLVGVGAFFLSFLWRWALDRKENGSRKEVDEDKETPLARVRRIFNKPRVKLPSISGLIILVALFPFITSMYQTNIMISALIYIMLGLGLNIVVGLGGLLNLGYAAFYSVGAYTYGLMFRYLAGFLGGNLDGLLFWIALPLAGITTAIAGILLALPVLRLRGDYLAIVTLAFAEIVRMLETNLDTITLGPSGIPGIPRPWFFGLKMTPMNATKVIYFIIIVLVILTIFMVRRLENSRLGRAWEARREDEIACESMGINITKVKLSSFALGAVWAGLAGVLLAAKTTVINPNSFTIWESVIVLCVIVLGGMGSIPGVITGALIIILLPEYLRAFSEYRMLIFGIVLVVMMIFRPGGFIPKVRTFYKFKEDE
ncbi:MAG: branched-chain amino acid ABC transporter permease [Spirochaetales bacterium]|nr:branched-chain amino acid ABC transporter permease [Spirochaetales bacterium]